MIQVLSKTLDMTKLSPEKIEIATLTRENNKTNIQILPAPRVRPTRSYLCCKCYRYSAVCSDSV
jgi:hypothetical protein